MNIKSADVIQINNVLGTGYNVLKLLWISEKNGHSSLYVHIWNLATHKNSKQKRS